MNPYTIFLFPVILTPLGAWLGYLFMGANDWLGVAVGAILGLLLSFAAVGNG